MKVAVFSENDLEKFILNFISQNKDITNMGFSICVQHEEKINFRRSFGYSRKDLKVPVTNQTLFSASSLAKAYTATAFLMKARGQLEILNQPLVKYIKDLVFMDEDITQKVTLVDVLSHRVGIPSHDLLWMLENSDRTTFLNKIKYMEMIPDSYQKVFSYSNILYAVLEIVFERLFNEKLIDFIYTNILHPLCMKQTFFREADIQKNQNLAWAYNQGRLLKRRDMDQLRTAGGLWISIEDLSLWMSSFGESTSIKKLLSKSELDIMFSSHISFLGPLPFISNGLEWMGNDLSYGLGWFVATPKEQKIYFHPGIIDGYTSLIVLIPALKLRFGVLSNDHMSLLPGLLVEKILSYLCNVDFSYSVNSKTVIVESESVDNNVVQLSMVDYVGTYNDKLYGTIQIVYENKKYWMKYNSKIYELKCISKMEALINLEVMEMQLPMVVNFQFNDRKVESLQIPFSLDPRVQTQSFKRVSKD